MEANLYHYISYPSLAEWLALSLQHFLQEIQIRSHTGRRCTSLDPASNSNQLVWVECHIKPMIASWSWPSLFKPLSCPLWGAVIQSPPFMSLRYELQSLMRNKPIGASPLLISTLVNIVSTLDFLLQGGGGGGVRPTSRFVPTGGKGLLNKRFPPRVQNS